MKYKILFDKNADKQLKKIDKTQQRIIVNWIIKNLENTNDPRVFGKALKGNLKDYWRYRVGDYRIIAEINDAEVKILIIEIGHRKDIYKKL
ncbi:type II toxin-antitoxin system RelE family toxin [Anaerosalibacter sp. Marseille-P3206]|uniref:type II toxin-antitoxin system RelE family toxin n=1 Tax=Anaerosalibacter sp. Marseille-P3206 TaxID=1871005 RepID=UPI000987B131|nr:type II toxin-antitoxin system RelE/ParE family toxin [Anaerosalibacter sp. Marseille-P3206]